MTIIRLIFSFLWQLPQNLIALVIMIVNHNNLMLCCYSKKFHICYLIGEYLKLQDLVLVDDKRFIFYYKVKYLFNSGISLGNFIFLDSDKNITDFDVRHEYGHSIQSKRLGWFYLIVVGIPSLIGNIVYRIKHKTNQWYYNLPWEKQADKLGKVSRF